LWSQAFSLPPGFRPALLGIDDLLILVLATPAWMTLIHWVQDFSTGQQRRAEARDPEGTPG
jgi:hypothetical protein